METNVTPNRDKIPQYGDAVYITDEQDNVLQITWVYEYKNSPGVNQYRVVDKSMKQRIVSPAEPIKAYHKRAWKAVS